MYLIVCVSSSMLVLVLLLTVKLICYRQGRQHSSPDGTLSKTYAEEISQEETSIDRTNVSTPSAVSIMPGYPPAEVSNSILIFNELLKHFIHNTNIWT